FGPVAWVAMVLVDAERRKQGIGTALMEHTLAYLEGRGVRSVRLDATPLGRPIYEKLGFVTEYKLIRFAGLLPGLGCPLAEPTLPDDVPGLLALDRRVTSTDRHKVLEKLFAEEPEAVRVARGANGSIRGFLVARPGARARQIGPCIGDRGAAICLLFDAMERYGRQTVFLDVPLPNRPAVDFAERALGLIVQ